LGFAEFADFVNQKGVCFRKLRCEFLPNRVLILENLGVEVNFFPKGQALDQTGVDLRSVEAELLHESASILLGVERSSREERLHEEADWECILLLERQGLDCVLDVGDADVVPAFAQSAKHDALKDEAHRSFESARIRVEQGKIKIEICWLQEQGCMVCA